MPDAAHRPTPSPVDNIVELHRRLQIDAHLFVYSGSVVAGAVVAGRRGPERSGLRRSRAAAASARRTSAIVARLRSLDAPRESDVAAIVREVADLVRRLPEEHPRGA
jgi:hypothetical protein